MEGLQEKLSQLVVSLDEIKEDNKAFGHRLKSLEDNQQAHGLGYGKPRTHMQMPTGSGADSSLQNPATGGHFSSLQNQDSEEDQQGNIDIQNRSALNEASPVQQEFSVIRDALQRVKLPADLKLDDSKQGVSRVDQKRLNVVQRCARYGETLLKLLSTMQQGNINPGDVQDLVTIAVAQVRYLQEEHSMLLVNNNFGEDVEKIYRQLRRNTSQFTPGALESLQAAVTLSSHTESPRRGRDSYGRGSSYRGSSYRGRRGYYPSYTRSRVPAYRQDMSYSNAAQGSQGNQDGQ